MPSLWVKIEGRTVTVGSGNHVFYLLHVKRLTDDDVYYWLIGFFSEVLKELKEWDSEYAGELEEV